MKYILAHDLGTSGNKATLYSEEGKLTASVTMEYELLLSNGNWAEQRANDWWQAVCLSTRKLLETVDPRDIAAVSFSGQMLGCLCVDVNGEPLDNSIIWADMRSSEEEEIIRGRIAESDFYRITGHRISPAYSLFKLLWMKRNKPEIYAKTHQMLNAKDYILFRLTGNFQTEYSDASSTCMMDLNTLQWSQELLETAELDASKLPELKSSIDTAGTVTAEAARATGLLEGTPVILGGGDGACAAVGTGCVREGIANCVLGTSSWISITSDVPIFDEGMTTFNFAHIVPGKIMPTGTIQTGGGALSWAVKTLYGQEDSSYSLMQKETVQSPLGARGLLFLPYLIGERSPRWDAFARGSFVGLTLDHHRGDMIRAVMEGVAMNLDLVLKVFEKRTDIRELITIGGGARNDLWLQIFADVFGKTIVKPNVLEEATSMGAAITGGVGVGLFEDFQVIDRFLQPEENFAPNLENTGKYGKFKQLFDESYFALKDIFKKLA
ncbi:MAG: xylulokinase [Thermoguttaceae bacterium]|nr:xylulokinase [Thermoguttaceae bacterium]MDO4424732.1 xylulokinase [Planctomycetia bacterium]